MTTRHLQDAIGNIDDAFIEEAAKAQVLKLKSWLPAAALAACVLLTAALLPWRAIFSFAPSPTTDPPTPQGGLLQNDDTSFFDTTKENEETIITLPDESTNESTKLPDTQKAEDTNIIAPPPETLPPIPDDTKSPDTEEKQNEETTPADKETTGPLIPSTPSTPDHGTVLPQYPTILSHTTYPVQKRYPSVEAQRIEWRIDLAKRISGYKSGIGNTDGFIAGNVSEFFSSSENQNLIYSPLNTYMTLGMLAETAGGNSRDQLLSILGENDIYSLRSSAKNLWNSCYRDDGIVTSVLGSSLWLDNSFTPKTAVTDILANDYYASSFYGDMGSKEYDELMRSWVNEQTKGFLTDTVSNSTLDPESMMSLMSTVYYKAEWAESFEPESTRSRVFHSPTGDVTADFMYRDFVGLRYTGNNFKATSLELKEGGQMWFLLPHKDVSLQSLFSDTEALDFITGKAQKAVSSGDHSAYMWLFLPKFDISSRVDLKSSLSAMGITDVFDPENADFSNLTDSNIFVNGMTQSARVSIDEKGCEAASASGGLHPAGPGVDDTDSLVFMLDRPFIFVVTSDSGLPLFVGTVYHPNLQ